MALRKTKKEILSIIESYEPYGRNSAEAARNLPFSYTTIRKYWREAGLLPENNHKLRGDGKYGRSLTAKEVEEIIGLHSLHGGNAKEAARHSIYSPPTIVRYWRENKLKIRRKGGRTPNLDSRLGK